MRKKDRSEEALGKNSNEGTSARTRPFSFEEIVRRRKKKLAAEPKETDRELRKLSEKTETDDESDLSDSDGGYKSTKLSRKAQKALSKKMEEVNFKREGYHLKGKVKGEPKPNHRKSRRDKESMSEKLINHRSRNSDRFEADSEKELEKNFSKEAEKDKHEKGDRKSIKEAKRKHLHHIDEISRAEIDGSYSKRHPNNRLREVEYHERNYWKEDRSQDYNEEPRYKRRKSRSPEYDRERDKRPNSVSPRAQKRYYHGRDYEDLQFHSHKDKLRRKYPDSDNYRMGNYKRYSSGFDGYSPRKRKTEAAVKTPSPTNRSPERKSATWDQPPAGKSHVDSGSVISNFQLPVNKMNELVSSISPSLMKPAIVFNAPIDSVQLTEATRPMRRLYIENLPSSASDRTVIDCLNEFLLSSGVKNIKRSNPCISCIINKEKCQALVEFLTPEDATSALVFDGKSLSGSVVKVRRPKDFVEAATGAPDSEKSISEAKAISDVVKDSPHKIFIGGISKALSSDMLMEIVSSFGLLKAYHVEFNKELNESFAFLEYTDHSNTLKACSGMNGMKLGGRVLTAVQALPDVHEESSDVVPYYGVPIHAKPLLEDPTQVLQFKNVFDHERFSMLSESELEETMEDIRLECARFGTVKSVNIVRHDNSYEAANQALKQDPLDNSSKLETEVENLMNDSKQNGGLPPSDEIKMLQSMGEAAEGTDNEAAAKHVEEIESIDLPPVDIAIENQEPHHPSDPLGEPPTNSDTVLDGNLDAPNEEDVMDADEAIMLAEAEDSNVEREVGDGDGERVPDGINVLSIKAEADRRVHYLDALKKPGTVLVEFLRAEAACTAAYCLHGRAYGEKIVSVHYIPHDIYQAQFSR